MRIFFFFLPKSREELLGPRARVEMGGRCARGFLFVACFAFLYSGQERGAGQCRAGHRLLPFYPQAATPAHSGESAVDLVSTREPKGPAPRTLYTGDLSLGAPYARQAQNTHSCPLGGWAGLSSGGARVGPEGCCADTPVPLSQ